MGIQIPCLLGDTKNTEGVPKSLGDLTQGCQILGGAGSPMTPGPGPEFLSTLVNHAKSTYQNRNSIYVMSCRIKLPMPLIYDFSFVNFSKYEPQVLKA